jgi:hypothetical protein
MNHHVIQIVIVGMDKLVVKQNAIFVTYVKVIDEISIFD